jgi:hypothetical protein
MQRAAMNRHGAATRERGLESRSPRNCRGFHPARRLLKNPPIEANQAWTMLAGIIWLTARKRRYFASTARNASR